MGTMIARAGRSNADNLAARYLEIRHIVGCIVVGIRDPDGNHISHPAGIGVAVGEVQRVIRAPDGEIQIQGRRISQGPGSKLHLYFHAAVVVAVLDHAAAPFWLLLDGTVPIMLMDHRLQQAADIGAVFIQTVFTVDVVNQLLIATDQCFTGEAILRVDVLRHIRQQAQKLILRTVAKLVMDMEDLIRQTAPELSLRVEAAWIVGMIPQFLRRAQEGARLRSRPALVGVAVGLQSADVDPVEGDDRKDQRIGGTEYHHAGHDADQLTPDASLFVSLDISLDHKDILDPHTGTSFPVEIE